MGRMKYDISNINFDDIKESLAKGKIIVYPTDTVYGVGASIDSIKGIENIYKAKERSFTSPLIALISKKEHIDKIAIIPEEKKEILRILAENYWPGALTIILKKKENVPGIMVSNGETVGVRIPNLKIAIDIIEASGGILPTTSANISGERTPRSYKEVNKKFKERVDILVDGGESPLGEESTIIDLTRDRIVILREGAIKKETIEKLIGKI
nr:L-threonylcarbamoyladenylate synthase [uncultured Cetobacterium sp.]